MQWKCKNIKYTAALIMGAFLLWAPGVVSAEGEKWSDGSDLACNSDASILSDRLVTDVCWDCIFPIRIAGVNTGASAGYNAPSGAASKPLCFCSPYPIPTGITFGAWFPSRVIEVVTKPYCFPALGGLSFSDNNSDVSKIQVGEERPHSKGGAALSFQHFHLYSFPIAAIVDMFDVFECIDGGATNMELLWFSELLPNWADEELALVLTPEATLFAGVVGVYAGVVECPVVTLTNKPFDAVFWAAGCWGSVYPMAGYQSGSADPPRNSALIATRAIAFLSRIGMETLTMGDAVKCHAGRTPILVKSQYRFQQYYPYTEAGSAEIPQGCAGGENEECNSGNVVPSLINSIGGACCHAIGSSPMKWGEWRNRPDNSVYQELIFKWVDCCIGW